MFYALQDIYVLFTLVLMVTITFWNGFATLLDSKIVDLYDSIAMYIFIASWAVFSIILAAVIFRKVSTVYINASTLPSET